MCACAWRCCPSAVLPLAAAMAFYIAAGAFAVLQFLAENPSVRLAIEEEASLLRRRLSAKARAGYSVYCRQDVVGAETPQLLQ